MFIRTENDGYVNTDFVIGIYVSPITGKSISGRLFGLYADVAEGNPPRLISVDTNDKSLWAEAERLVEAINGTV